MLKWFRLFGISSLLLLSACTQMDRRSDLPEKKPLPGIEGGIAVTKKWHVNVGNGTDKKDIKLQLVKSGDTLYTVDNSGTLFAVDEKDGRICWKLELRASVSSGPSIGEGKLVVGTSTGKVIAVDVAQQKIAWVSPSTSEVLAAPKISDGIVFIHTMDGGLSAMSLIDGRQLWRFNHSLPPLMLRRSSTPAIYSDYVIVGLSNGKLLAMQKNDGSVVWTHEVAQPKGTNDLQRMEDISADPLVKGDVVYAASYQSNIAAITANNGHLLWEREISSYSGFALEGGFLYVSATNGDVVALDTSSGQTYWLQTELHGRRLTQPAIMGKYLVVADEDGFVHWIDRSSGKLVGRYQLDKDGVEATPIVNNNIVYILGRTGKLVAFEAC